jgi:hypothetical protein
MVLATKNISEGIWRRGGEIGVAAAGIHQDDIEGQVPLHILDDRVLGRLEVEIIDAAEGSPDLIEQAAGFPKYSRSAN